MTQCISHSVSLTTDLPDDLLGKWLLLVAGASFFNSFQNMTSISITQRIYSKQPTQVTGVSARTFAVWTFLAGIIRVYAAYDLHNPTLYNLSLWSFGLAWFHFLTEWMVYKTAGVGPGLLSPVIVATTSLIWMLSQKDYYLK